MEAAFPKESLKSATPEATASILNIVEPEGPKKPHKKNQILIIRCQKIIISIWRKNDQRPVVNLKVGFLWNQKVNEKVKEMFSVSFIGYFCIFSTTLERITLNMTKPKRKSVLTTISLLCCFYYKPQKWICVQKLPVNRYESQQHHCAFRKSFSK